MSSPPASSTSGYVSEQIKQEIQRFESVHPCIYSVYDLISLIDDQIVADQIRDQVICIEDSFVNSQEWTLSRSVPELKLGVVGHVLSGKSALVHRYLTGSYMHEESPEGGRFKKEVVIDRHSYLLLIRDEGGALEQQFTQWVDAIVFVFSLENEISFNAVYNYYMMMAHYKNIADVPMILVGTQDAICDTSPRLIDDARARKLAHELKRCAYYETCATYGLNVEKVFRDACLKIIHARSGGGYPRAPSRTPTPTTPSRRLPPPTDGHHHHQQRSVSSTSTAVSPSLQLQHSFLPHHAQQPTATQSTPNSARYHNQSPSQYQFTVPSIPPHSGTNGNGSRTSQQHALRQRPDTNGRFHRDVQSTSMIPQIERQITPPTESARSCNGLVSAGVSCANETFDNHISPPSIPTPTSTPNAQRKNRRISNIFPLKSRDKDDEKASSKNGDHLAIGCGRPIPTKQGQLYKRSSKALNKEWKKKYVSLYANGKLSYHSSLKEYMENNSPGKEIFLGLATVKLPTQQRLRQRRAQTQPITVPPTAANDTNGISCDVAPDECPAENGLASRTKGLLTAMEFLEENATPSSALAPPPASVSGSEPDSLQSRSEPTQPNNGKKKRGGLGHRRFGSGAKFTDIDDGEECEFVIVTCDQKQWHFEAATVDERVEWVSAIEEQISRSLQDQMSTKEMDASCARHSHAPRSDVAVLRRLPGNDVCVDCSQQNPDWASLNLGALMCIECSGIHRNLGSHISRVRSLDLDDWSLVLISIMKSIGNITVNEYWEYNLKGRRKPTPESSRQEKEEYIRAKYETAAFRRALPPMSSREACDRIVDGVIAKDLLAVWRLLPVCRQPDVNATLNWRDQRTPLHLACSVGSPEITQILLWVRRTDVVSRGV